MKKQKLDKIDQLFVDAQKPLATSNYSTKKMKEFLKKKGGSKNEIEEVIFKLKKYAFLDEDEIVKNVLSYCDAKHYGHNKIISMLKLREIDQSKIDNIIYDEVRELKESKNMQNRLIKRYKNKNTVNLKQSIYNALIRYSFEENIASLRAKEVYKTSQEEINVLKLDYLKLVSSYSRKLKDKKLKEKVKDSLLSKGYKLNDIRKVESNI